MDTDEPQGDERAIRREAVRAALEQAYSFYQAYVAALYNMREATGYEWSADAWTRIEALIGELYDDGATVEEATVDEVFKRSSVLYRRAP